MNKAKKVFQTVFTSFFGAFLTMVIGWLLIHYSGGVGYKLVQVSYDLSCTIPKLLDPPPKKKDVVLVYMDDNSYASLNQDYNKSWDRRLHAMLLRRLKEDGARAAVFDILFTDTTDTPAFPDTPFDTADEMFANAMDEFAQVVLACEKVEIAKTQDRKRGSAAAAGAMFMPPIEPFLDNAAAVGNVMMLAENDLVVRRHTPVKIDDFVHPLSWATASILNLPAVNNEETASKNLWINYYGDPGYLPHISYHHVFRKDLCPPGFFKDKVVFVGARIYTKTAGERKDAYPSPWSYWVSGGQNTDLFMPGVEIHATMFLNLLHQDWLTRMNPWDEGMMILLLGLFFGFGLALLRPFFAGFAGIFGIAVILGLAYYMVVETNHWFAWAIVVVQILVAMGWSIVYNSINLFVQKQLMQHSLDAYVSPAQVKRIIKKPDMLKPGAVKQEISILFSDIANFTSMSEGMDSDELAKLMNNYFEIAVTDCIQKSRGTVIKYIGDAIFAIWNAPEEQDNHQANACYGALWLRDGVRDAFAHIQTNKELRTRIGLHSGQANVGNFGSARRFDYTAIGENVNLAARMEGLNKYLGTDILITGAVENVVRGQFVTRFLGYFILKGFVHAFEVYELVDEPKDEERSRPWREAFDRALNLFQEKKFEDAKAAFHQVLEIKPNDGPSLYYLNQFPSLDPDKLPPDWRGEIELKEK